MKITILECDQKTPVDAKVEEVHEPEKPLYTHDCANCVFLGRYTYDAPHATGVGENRREWTEPKTVDCYYCHSQSSMGGTMLARFSSNGPDYSSCTADILDQNIEKMLAKPIHQLGTFTPGYIAAFLRAEKQGIYKRRKNRK